MSILTRFGGGSRGGDEPPGLAGIWDMTFKMGGVDSMAGKNHSERWVDTGVHFE